MFNMKKSFLLSVNIVAAVMLFVFSLSAYDMYGQIKTKVVAHRGHWDVEGSAQNSIASLKKSQEVGAYACEFDINMTTDGVLVVCHGPNVGEIADVQNATYADVMKVTLENGEKVPTLEQFLKAAKKMKYPLVLEIKAPANAEKGKEIVTKAAYMLKKFKVLAQTQIISFSLDVCKEAVKQLPGTMVQYLTGDKTPYELKSMGINGMDYHHSLVMLNPEYIEQAHDLGMVVNVWTVDDPVKIQTFAQLGVDYITTNKPELAKTIIEQVEASR
jgi:glycerophosphoryl diester phosphodiesterase